MPQHTLVMVRCRDGEPAWQWDDGYWTKAHLAITGNMGALGFGRAFCGDFLVVTSDRRWIAFSSRRSGRLRLPAAEVIDLTLRRPAPSPPLTGGRRVRRHPVPRDGSFSGPSHLLAIKPPT